MKQYELTLLIPILNDERSLPDTLRRIDEALLSSDLKVEVVFVDDGSTDASFEVLRSYCKWKDYVHIIKLAKNFGLHTALCAGFEHASSPIVATMEGHPEHNVSDIFRLYSLMGSNVDIVFARRFNRRDAWWRFLASRIINSLLKFICGIKVHDINCLLKVWRREAGLLTFADPSYAHFFASLCSMQLIEIDVDFSLSRQARSSFSFGRLFYIAVELLKTAAMLRLQGMPLPSQQRKTKYEIAVIL